MKLDEFERAVAEFVWAVVELFDRDWEYTSSMFMTVGEGGTFLEPNVVDEASDWGNRALFLEQFRKLRGKMRELGIKPISPLDDLNTDSPQNSEE